MSLVFGGISEGTFAFYIIFCTLIGMVTGAYLMDRKRFTYFVKDRVADYKKYLQLVREKINA